ncbi:WD40 repeat domain-containing protein [Micromonospora sp. Llam0]|uniref:WD40 repeat domain-containing protein n=1 Tax=Micromonospora sp. Llam0 TaxID=2485143 RepID=UPI001315A762|nr:WD40 repeat domain-containing protein [Micromonospora sp. Llam0]
MANGREVVVFAGVDRESLPVRFIDLDSGALLPDRSVLHGADSLRLLALAAGAGRTLMVTSTNRGVLVVRDARTGEPAGPPAQAPEQIRAVAAGVVDAREVAGACCTEEVRVWDPVEGTVITEHGFGGYAFVHHRGRLLVVAGDGETWQMRDALTGEPYGEPFAAHGSLVGAVVSRGRVLVVSLVWRAGPATPVRAWDVTAAAEITLGALWHAEQIEGVEPSLGGLALAEWDNRLAAAVTWFVKDGSARAELWLPGAGGSRRVSLPDTATVAAVLPHDGRLVTATAGRSGALAVTDARSPYYGGPVRSFNGWARRSGRTLAVLSGDPDMLYDINAGRPFTRVTMPEDPADRPVAAAVEGRGFRVWDTVTGEELMRRDGQYDRETGALTAAVTAVAYREMDGHSLLATGGDNGSVRLWDVATGEALGALWHGHTGRVTALAITQWRDRPVVLSAETWGPPRMWMIDFLSGVGHTDSVTSVAGGVRGGLPVFASGSEDGTIRFWDASTGADIGPIIRSGTVDGLALAGNVLITSGEGLVRRWDAVSGEPVGEPFSRSESEPGRLATAEMDGHTLVAAVIDQHLCVWDVATGESHTTMPLPGRAALYQPGGAQLLDITVHDGRLVAMTVEAPHDDLFPAADDDTQQITVWDVAAAAPLFPPMLTSDDGGHGAFGVVEGRLTAAHGVDAEKNEGEGVWPEEAGDVYLRDMATGEIGIDSRPDAGWNQQLVFARARGRDVLLVAADNAVVLFDAATGRDLTDRVNGLAGAVTCVAVTQSHGHTFGAAGDGAGGVRIWEIVPRPE